MTSTRILLLQLLQFYLTIAMQRQQLVKKCAESAGDTLQELVILL